MKEHTLKELYESRLNGNISEFNEAVKHMSKLDMLNYIEIARGYGGQPCHITIPQLRQALDK